MRITGGEFGGRRLKVPGRGVRPTQDRVREALFSSLAARIPDCRFLDLFAGSGAVGLEAMSRGASEVLWVEHDGRAARGLKENLIQIAGARNKDAAAVRVIQQDAVKFLASCREEPFGIIFADPPYGLVGREERLKKALQALGGANILAEDGVFVLEQSSDEPSVEIDGIPVTKEKSYGDTVLRYYMR